MNIEFLSRNEAKEYFKEPDLYTKNLPESNLAMMNLSSQEEYHENFINSFIDFSQEEKTAIQKHLEILNFIDLNIKVVKTTKAHQLDIIQTRKKAIVIPNETSINSSLLVHEVFHIISRNFNIKSLYQIVGFDECEPQTFNDPLFIINPDCVISNYKIDVVINGQIKSVIPYITPQMIKLKELNTNNYFLSMDSDIYQKVKNTNYVSHPEEICAELFALLITGTCIYPANIDNGKLKEFKTELMQLLKENNIIKKD